MGEWEAVVLVWDRGLQETKGVVNADVRAPSPTI